MGLLDDLEALPEDLRSLVLRLADTATKELNPVERVTEAAAPVVKTLLEATDPGILAAVDNLCAQLRLVKTTNVAEAIVGWISDTTGIDTTKPVSVNPFPTAANETQTDTQVSSSDTTAA